MKIVLFIAIFILLSGCHGVDKMIDSNALVVKKKSNGFATKIDRFDTDLQAVKTIQDRNKVVDDLLNASDMECSSYQYNLNQPQDDTQTDSVYTYLFKKVGQYIGFDIAKDAIEAVSAMSDSTLQKSNQDRYTQALKPNIIKAIEIARKKYKKTIQKHKQLDLQHYSIKDVKEDLKAYDKRCSTYYGLLEITNALQKQQEVSNKEIKSIDVEGVKKTIKEVTKEVTKKENIDQNCSIIKEMK